MIISANPVMKVFWKWVAKRKLRSEDPVDQFNSLRILGEFIDNNEINIIFEKTSSSNQLIRIGAAFSLRQLYDRIELELDRSIFEELVLAKFTQTLSLQEKIILLEVIRHFPLYVREEVLAPLILQSDFDLQYGVIKTLSDSKNPEILDNVLESSRSSDLVLRKTALSTWYSGIENVDFVEPVEYCTPRLHFLIRASYELQSDGLLLKKVLSYASKNDLPIPKAYPDFIIRYLTELLSKWEYDPDAYISLHAIAVPSYFTFDSEDTEGEEPFLIL